MDHNIAISALIFRGGNPRRVLELALEGAVQLVTSTQLLDELEDRMLTKFDYPGPSWRGLRTEMEGVADLVEVEEVPSVCRDPDDDILLATAKAGKASWIVSGDKDLLVLGSYCGVEIVAPSRFLELFEGQA